MVDWVRLKVILCMEAKNVHAVPVMAVEIVVPAMDSARRRVLCVTGQESVRYVEEVVSAVPAMEGALRIQEESIKLIPKIIRIKKRVFSQKNQKEQEDSQVINLDCTDLKMKVAKVILSMLQEEQRMELFRILMIKNLLLWILIRISLIKL